MARKTAADSGKREEIVSAAQACFFEKGYDATSIREIMRKAGAEVGLFYYYFTGKDEVFDQAMEQFFGAYRRSFREITDRVYRDPYRTMTRFFYYMITATNEFRDRYEENMHRSVCWAVRERMLSMIVPYLKEIVQALVVLGARPPLDLDVTAVMLAHGVGSTILHEDSEWMARQRSEAEKGAHLLMGMDLDTAELMFPREATLSDIPGMADLVEGSLEHFPGYERSGFIVAMERKVGKKAALVLRHRGRCVGCVGFSRPRQSIDLLLVAPEYRGQGVATRLMTSALSEFPVGSQVSVVTYREGDSLGIGARSFYHKLGFRDGELVSEYDYPLQRLTVTVPDCLPQLRELKERNETAPEKEN